jgi:hypothetical protein
MIGQWIELIDYSSLIFHGLILLAAVVWLTFTVVKGIKKKRKERKKQKFQVIQGGKIKRVS